MKKYLKTRMEVSGSSNQSQPTNADAQPQEENEGDVGGTPCEKWVMLHFPWKPKLPDSSDPLTIKQEVIPTDYLANDQPTIGSSICKTERSMSPENSHRYDIYPPLPPEPPLPDCPYIIKQEPAEPNETLPKICEEFIRGKCSKEMCEFEHRIDLAQILRSGLIPTPLTPLTRPPSPASPEKTFDDKIFSDKYEENGQEAPEYQMENQSPQSFYTHKRTICSYFFRGPCSRDLSYFAHQRDCVSPPLTNNPPPPKTGNSPLPQTNQPPSPDKFRIPAPQTNQPVCTPPPQTNQPPNQNRLLIPPPPPPPQISQPPQPNSICIPSPQINQPVRTPPPQTNQPLQNPPPQTNEPPQPNRLCIPPPPPQKNELPQPNSLRIPPPQINQSFHIPPPQTYTPFHPEFRFRPPHTYEPPTHFQRDRFRSRSPQTYEPAPQFHRDRFQSRPPHTYKSPTHFQRDQFQSRSSHTYVPPPQFQRDRFQSRSPHRYEPPPQFEQDRFQSRSPQTYELPTQFQRDRFQRRSPHTYEPPTHFQRDQSQPHSPHTYEPQSFKQDSFTTLPSSDFITMPLGVGHPPAFKPDFGLSHAKASYTSPPINDSYKIAMQIEEILIQLKMEKEPKMEETEQPPPLHNVCRDFIRGNCKRDTCIFIHDRCINKEIDRSLIFKFCRDFQNGVCKFSRTCKYVHATIFEEYDFYRTGKLPVHLMLIRPPLRTRPAPEDLPAIANNSLPTSSSEVSPDEKKIFKDESDAAAKPEDAVIDAMVESLTEKIKTEWKRINLLSALNSDPEGEGPTPKRRKSE